MLILMAVLSVSNCLKTWTFNTLWSPLLWKINNNWTRNR